MNISDCEKAQQSLMAQSTGEEPVVSVEQVNSHLASCEACRSYTAELAEMDQLLMRQTLRSQNVDLWPQIQKQIASQGKATNWRPFALLCVLLVAYKFCEMLSQEMFALVLNFIPLLLIAGLFALIKENPFRINSEIVLER